MAQPNDLQHEIPQLIGPFGPPQPPVPGIQHAAGQIPNGAPVINPPAQFYRLPIARFKNAKESARINAWLNLFEQITEGNNDFNRIRSLMLYVEGEAQTWYGDEVSPHAGELTWVQVRQRMVDRFGFNVRPLIAIQKRFLQKTETVQQYYDEKMDLIRQTNLIEADRIAVLTEGMPYSYQTHLIASGVLTTSAWLSCALQLESSLSRRNNSQYRPIPQAAACDMGDRASSAKDKKKPHTPCNFCKKLGKELFHWHSECRNNPNIQKQSKPKATVQAAAEALAASPEN